MPALVLINQKKQNCMSMLILRLRNKLNLIVKSTFSVLDWR